jgi:hypothetical protein
MEGKKKQKPTKKNKNRDCNAPKASKCKWLINPEYKTFYTFFFL